MIKIGKSTDHISFYSCQPKTRDELASIIKDRISKEGPECDLNDIDVSKVPNMTYLFYGSEFNGDISKWNTINVEDMSGMFFRSTFNGDISNWDVSNVKYMNRMFANSSFDGDISKWNVINVKDMEHIFARSLFNQDISKWNINKNCLLQDMFLYCPIKNEYKPKSLQS